MEGLRDGWEVRGRGKRDPEAEVGAEDAAELLDAEFSDGVGDGEAGGDLLVVLALGETGEADGEAGAGGEVEGVEEGGGVAALEEGLQEAGEPLEGGGGHEEGVAEGVRGAGEGIGVLKIAFAFVFAVFGGEGECGGELVGEEEEREDGISGIVWRDGIWGERENVVEEEKEELGDEGGENGG